MHSNKCLKISFFSSGVLVCVEIICGMQTEDKSLPILCNKPIVSADKEKKEDLAFFTLPIIRLRKS